MANKTLQKYPFAVSILHGLVGLAMLSTLVIGWLLDDHEELMKLHRSLGVTVILLVILRIAVRISHRSALPRSVNQTGSLAYLAEKSVHGLLYLSMLAVPLLGWLKTNASGHAASFFGVFDLPRLMAKNPGLSHVLGGAHSLSATIFALLVGLHVAGALANLVTHKDNVFKRILPYPVMRQAEK